MKSLDRKLRRAAPKSRKERLPGIHNEVCLGCAGDLAQGKEDDHMAGRKHSDIVWPLCKSTCHPKRSEYQREQPPPSENPRNVFEVIGRWLLSVKEYFELMAETFERFGLFLIDLAKQGYGEGLQLP
jgi:hypothetical protein